MRDGPPELNGIAFHFHEGSAKRRLLLPLCECFLEQTTETFLLPLNPQQILNLFPRTRAWDLRTEEYTT